MRRVQMPVALNWDWQISLPWLDCQMEVGTLKGSESALFLWDWKGKRRWFVLSLPWIERDLNCSRIGNDQWEWIGLERECKGKCNWFDLYLYFGSNSPDTWMCQSGLSHFHFSPLWVSMDWNWLSTVTAQREYCPVTVAVGWNWPLVSSFSSDLEFGNQQQARIHSEQLKRWWIGCSSSGSRKLDCNWANYWPKKRTWEWASNWTGLPQQSFYFTNSVENWAGLRSGQDSWFVKEIRTIYRDSVSVAKSG